MRHKPVEQAQSRPHDKTLTAGDASKVKWDDDEDDDFSNVPTTTRTTNATTTDPAQAMQKQLTDRMHATTNNCYVLSSSSATEGLVYVPGFTR